MPGGSHTVIWRCELTWCITEGWLPKKHGSLDLNHIFITNISGKNVFEMVIHITRGHGVAIYCHGDVNC